jgi:hypothetical protein
MGQAYYDWNASGRLKASLSIQEHNGQEFMRIRGICVAKVEMLVPKSQGDSRDLQAQLFSLQHRYREYCVAWTVTLGTSIDRLSLAQDWSPQSRHLDDYRAYIAQDMTSFSCLLPMRRLLGVWDVFVRDAPECFADTRCSKQMKDF